MKKIVLLRVTTVPISLKILLRGQLKFMSECGFEVIAVSADGGEVKSFIEGEGVPHIAIPLTRTISPLADLRALYLLSRVIRKYRPQIVHSHTPKAGLIAMVAAWW